MTDLQATLDAIDEVAVHECGHCRHPLDPDGPSWDFCSESCQVAWTRDRHEVHELVGYRAPLTAALDELRHLEESAVRQLTPSLTLSTSGEDFQRESTTLRARFGQVRAQIVVPNCVLERVSGLQSLPRLLQAKVTAGRPLQEALLEAFQDLLREHWDEYRQRWVGHDPGPDFLLNHSRGC